MIDGKERDNIKDHELRLTNIRWHLAQGAHPTPIDWTVLTYYYLPRRARIESRTTDVVLL